MGEYVMRKILLLSLCLLMVASFALAKSDGDKAERFESNTAMNDDDAWRQLMGNSQVRRAAAQLDTTFYMGRTGAPYGTGTFEGIGDQCDWAGWTRNDPSLQLDNYWHVDDFAGLTGTHGGLVALEGNQSMWCGARPDNTHPILCSYVNLPGYANSWSQSLGTAPLAVTGDVHLGFQIFWDSENEYDFTFVQYDLNDGNWQDLVTDVSPVGPGLDGTGQWDTTLTVPAASHSGTIRFRFWFKSDGAWSDGDGGGNSDGGCTVDALIVDDGNGNVLPLEDFEVASGQNVGDNNGNNWTSSLSDGYGELANTFQGIDVVQTDPCFVNETCVWGFFNGSTSNYSCGTPSWPDQLTVPYENSRGQYVDQQIWSPWMDISQETGTVFELTFNWYRDLTLTNWVLSDWHVRGIDSTDAIPCPSNWFGDGFVNYGDERIWVNSINPVGLIVPSGSSHIQISLDVVDYCQYGFPCANACHSHAPVYDNVSLYRVGAVGPQWDVRDIDQFQDNFPLADDIVSAARADMASDNNWPEPTQGIVPGDSAVVQVSDPASGLKNVINSRAHVFFYCSIDGPHSATAPAALVCDARYNYITDVAAGGRTWHQFQADTCYTEDGLVAPDDYNFDFCDDLFTPGDTIWHFWGAENTDGIITYAAASYLGGEAATEDIDEIAAIADEFQILPAVGRDVEDGGLGGDILYVEGMNFRGAQPYFDTAFQNLGILHLVDRYDIRGPSSGISNHPGSRVASATSQLIPIYRKIIWNTGNLNDVFGDGTGDDTDKSPDTQLCLAFMDNLGTSGGKTGGIYLNGDEVAHVWASWSDPSAQALRNVYMGFGIVSTDHEPVVGFNPWGVGVPGGIFSEGGVQDTIVVEGGCPFPNTFDVLDAVGADTKVEMNYHDWRPDSTFAPAVLSQLTVNTVGDTVGFVLSGFSFHYQRDYKAAGFPARYTHMRHILAYLSNITDQPTGAKPTSVTQNNLDQNVPNPFNPTTTIKYEVKESGLVSLRIYNVAGQLVKTLVDGQRVAGQVYEANWNGLNNSGQPVSSGVYFYKLVAKNFTQTKKMVLLK